MKFVKYSLIVIGVIFVAYFVLCATAAKKFVVNKSLVINAPADAIWPELANFNNWQAWSPWHKYDSAMVNTYSGDPGAVGHKNSWTSTIMGNGSQEIVEIETNTRMKTALIFADWGPNNITYSDYILAPEGEGSKATWTMDGSEIPFVFRGLMVLMGAQASVEKDYEDGLAALKKIVEAKPKMEVSQLVTEEITIEDVFYVGKRWPKINEKDVNAALFADTYGQLGKFIGGMEKMTGAPFSIGHSFDYATHDMDLEIAVQVANEMKPSEGFTSGKIPSGKAIKYIYHGPYEKTSEAWAALMTQVSKTHKIRWSGYEVYIDDPTGKDMSQVATWLIVPVE